MGSVEDGSRERDCKSSPAMERKRARRFWERRSRDWAIAAFVERSMLREDVSRERMRFS